MTAIQNRVTHILLVLVLLALLAVIGMLATGVRGGPLDPADPPSGTMKTLDEVEPRIAVNALPGDLEAVHVISAPGSYYLTGNVSGETGKHGIRIEANNVTLDLNGFVVDGSGVANTLDGIAGAGAVEDEVEVRNGIVRGWGEDGIDLEFVSGVRVSNVESSFNTLDGIKVNETSQVRDCIATDNGEDGIQADEALISGCYLESNVGDGIEVSSHSVVRENQVRANGGGIHASATFNRIEDNHLTSNNVQLDIDFGNNIIARNSLNTNFELTTDIAGNNAIGPPIPADSPIQSESPWANFELQ